MEEGLNLGGWGCTPRSPTDLGSIPMGFMDSLILYFDNCSSPIIFFTKNFVTSEIWITKKTDENMFSAILPSEIALVNFATKVMNYTLSYA